MKKELRLSASKEVRNIKKHATKKEISRLDYRSLRPQYQESCIYGQMTGDCFSERANYLIGKCAVRYTEEIPFNSDAYNEEEIHLTEEGLGEYATRNYSALELYIFSPEAKSEHLISWLKGDIKNLRL